MTLSMWLLLYFSAVAYWAVFFHPWLTKAAWMAPRSFVIAAAAIGGLFWPVVLLALSVWWAMEAGRGRG